MHADLNEIHRTLVALDSRAEKVASEQLQDTFVDAEPLFSILQSNNNQIIYGRRGTGKTHAFKYLERILADSNQEVVFIDLRSVGSNGSIYADISKPFSQRATLLLKDVLAEIHDKMIDVAIDKISDVTNATHINELLDRLEKSVSDVLVKTDLETATETEAHNTKTGNLKGSLTTAGNGGLEATKNATAGKKSIDSIRAKAVHRHYVNFGDLQNTIRDLLGSLGIEKFWILLDEWSEVPLDLQPFLADLLRRTLLPINGITLKIAAIEHRANFRENRPAGGYIGFELGADIFADLNLDDFMVFDNDGEKSVAFFKSLLFKHFSAVSPDSISFKHADNLIDTLFTKTATFDEFVRAAEGVPRDAIHLISQVVRSGYGKKLSVEHIRSGARKWYTQDKSSILKSNPLLSDTLQYIIDHVIGQRKARAFLFRSDRKNPVIEELFDARLVHILKKNVSDRDNPGQKYDVYKLDYGCYVDLINTSQAPTALFQTDDGGKIEVPPDDYRSIRRAILEESQLDRLIENHKES